MLCCPSICTPAGLDFVLDGALHPWLLEVNASPSLAWNNPGNPDASRLMWQVKQQVVADMFAVLRLQDRFPCSMQKSAAQDARAGAAGAAEASAGSSSGSDVDDARVVSTSSSTAGSMQQQQQPWQQDHNTLMLQAASEQYFRTRPLVAELVAYTAEHLAAAAAATPTRWQVLAQVQERLRQLDVQQLGQQQRQLQQDERSHALAHVTAADVRLLQQHVQQLVTVECELLSAGQRWQSLLPHMPSQQQAAQHGWDAWLAPGHLRHGAAVRLWLNVRPT